MKVLDLTVLAFDGPVVRAYLRSMRVAAIAPRKIIDLRFESSSFKYAAACRVLGRHRANDLWRWRRRRRVEGARFHTLCQLLSEALPATEPICGSIDYHDYAHEVERVWVRGMRDPELVRAVQAQECRVLLFTGGGILGRELLSVPGVRALHVHPGVLPHVRGSDGLLWSLLLRGRPGASCFYMNSLIDGGDIIATCDFDRPRFDPSIRRFEPESIYIGLLRCYDPWLRATLLSQVLTALQRDQDLGRLPAEPQTVTVGRTFFTMHPRLRNRVIEALVRGEPLPQASGNRT